MIFFKMFECYSVKLKVFLFTGIYLNLVFSTSTQILPEPLVSFDRHNSACYGPAATHGQYRPSCPNNKSVIAIQKLKVGAKPVSSGCPSIVTKVNDQIVDSLNISNVLNETACCLPDDSVDCSLEFNYANSGLNYLYHKNSSGYTESKPNMDVIWAPTDCQEDQFHYPEATHFMFLEFSCIERTRIGNLCSTNTYSISDDAFYLYNTDYPHSVSSFIDLCQCQITTTGQSILFYSIDIRLEKYGNECKQTLNITDSNGVTLLDCASATIFNVTKAAKTRAVTLTFKNDLPVDGGNIWIGFSSEEKETLRIECGYQMKQVTTKSSTHNEVSSAAPDGTITAIQSQTSTTTSINLTPTGSYLHQYSESDRGHFDTLSERTDTFSAIIETSTKMYTSTEESVATSFLQSSLSKITTTAFLSSTFTASRTTTDILFSRSQYTTISVNVSNTSRSPLLTQDMSSGSSNSQSRTSTSVETISSTTSSGNYQTSSNAGSLSDHQTIIIKEESVATSYLESSLANKGTTTHFQSPTFTASRTITDILFSTSQYTTTSVNESNISRSSLLAQDMSSSSSNSQSMTSTSVETISPTTSSRNYHTSSNAGTLSDQQTIIVQALSANSSGFTVVYVFLGLILSVLTGAAIYLFVRKRCTDQAVQPVESNGESAITTETSDQRHFNVTKTVTEQNNENASNTSNQGDTFELNDNRPASLRQSINSDESYVSIRPGAQPKSFRLPNILSRSNGSKYGNEVENGFDEINIEHVNSAQPKKKYKKKKRSKKQRKKESMGHSKKKRK